MTSRRLNDRHHWHEHDNRTESDRHSRSSKQLSEKEKQTHRHFSRETERAQTTTLNHEKQDDLYPKSHNDTRDNHNKRGEKEPYEKKEICNVRKKSDGKKRRSEKDDHDRRETYNKVEENRKRENSRYLYRSPSVENNKHSQRSDSSENYRKSSRRSDDRYISDTCRLEEEKQRKRHREKVESSKSPIRRSEHSPRRLLAKGLLDDNEGRRDAKRFKHTDEDENNKRRGMPLEADQEGPSESSEKMVLDGKCSSRQLSPKLKDEENHRDRDVEKNNEYRRAEHRHRSERVDNELDKKRLKRDTDKSVTHEKVKENKSSLRSDKGTGEQGRSEASAKKNPFPVKAPPLTEEQKRQQRLERIKKLMTMKKSQGLVPEASSVTPLEMAESDEVAYFSIKSHVRKPIASEEAVVTSSGTAAFESAEPFVAPVVSFETTRDTESTNSEETVDSLDAFMTGIQTEVGELAELDRNRKRRRRRRGQARSPPASSNSISLEEILAFTKKQAKALTTQEYIEESETKLLEAEFELTPNNIKTGIETVGAGITTKEHSGTASLVVSDSSAAFTSGGGDESASSSTTGAEEDSNVDFIFAIKSPSDVSVLIEEEEDDLYYKQFVAEMKKKQQEELEKAEKAREEAAALAAKMAEEKEGKAKKAKDIEEEEEIAVLPGSVDIGTDEKAEIVEEEEDYRYNIPDESVDQTSYFDLVEKVGNKKELPEVDHSKIDYPPFKRNLYIQVREITLMKDHEIDMLRKLYGGIRVRGKACPRPIKTFYQCGLPDAILKIIEKREYSEPFPIQMQALPTLMAGRDVIGIAETGSGKTLAYLLPMLRHIMDQPPLKIGDGPIGLILAPTRELAVQIQKEANRFAKCLNLRSVAVYGGTGIGEQLSALKRGAEIVVATPGRLIDVLTINAGKVTNLRRVTFCILDEADRMFDLGFEPQITAVLKNIRPDRQTALFSATFPPHIEALARKILKKPIEIIVGEKGQTAHRIEQHVEVWKTKREKFLRLLQLLGEWHQHGSIIIFVARQTEADDLFAELLKMGYTALVLHGGQDQTDREFTIQDFKDGASNILIATSVAARGIDVKSVVLVINYVAPDHLEDYVHRIGRTGRAGNIGVAYTFITPEESDKADDLVKALKQSGKEVKLELQQLAESFRIQCNMGLLQQRKGKGFGGKGFKFTAAEKSRQQQERQKAKKDLGLEDEEEEEPTSTLEADELDNPMAPLPPPTPQTTAPVVSTTSTTSSVTTTVSTLGFTPTVGITTSAMTSSITTTVSDVTAASARAKALAELATRTTAVASGDSGKTDERSKQLEAVMSSVRQRVVSAAGQWVVPINTTQQLGLVTSGQIPGLSAAGYIDPATGNAVDEFDINDYPQYARFKITHKETLHRLADSCGAVLQVKGRYISPEETNSPLMAGVKRLYIEIIGSTPIVVQRAKHEIRSLAEQVAMKQLNLPSSQKQATGRYSVV